jgi:hypothetical protein
MRRLTAAILGALTLAAAAPAAAQSCDRACLSDLADRYVAALMKRDPSGLPFATGAKFTENTARLKVGEGLWLGASADSLAFKYPVIDVPAGQVGLMAFMKEHGRPIILILRLKVADRRIAEVQQIVQREIPHPESPGLRLPRPAMLADVTPARRTPRAEIARIADSYFDALVANNGDLTPFADDCSRHESGERATHVSQSVAATSALGRGTQADSALQKILQMGCRDQVSSNILAHITRIEPRGPILIDDEKGLAMAFPVFVHRGDVQTVKLRGVPGVDTLDTPTRPSDTHAGEIFKIWGGQIHEVEVGGVRLPYGLPTGW